MNPHPDGPCVLAHQANFAIKLAVNIQCPRDAVHQALKLLLRRTQHAHGQPLHLPGLVAQHSGGMHAHALHGIGLGNHQTNRGVIHQGLKLQLQLPLTFAMTFPAATKRLQGHAQSLSLAPVMTGQPLPPVRAIDAGIGLRHHAALLRALGLSIQRRHGVGNQAQHRPQRNGCDRQHQHQPAQHIGRQPFCPFWCLADFDQHPLRHGQRHGTPQLAITLQASSPGVYLLEPGQIQSARQRSITRRRDLPQAFVCQSERARLPVHQQNLARSAAGRIIQRQQYR